MTILRTPQVCDEIGITYRVLDYWIRNEAVEPAVQSFGSGSPRLFSADDVNRLKFVSHFYHKMPRMFTIDLVRTIWHGDTRMEEYDTHYEMELDNGIVLSVPKE